MNRPLNKTFLACALAMAWGTALAAGPATVTVKKGAEGTLVITNIEGAGGAEAGAAKPVPSPASAEGTMPGTETTSAPVARVEAPGREGDEAADRETEEQAAREKERARQQPGEGERLESSGMGTGPLHGPGDGGFMGSGLGPGQGVGGGAPIGGGVPVAGGGIQESGGTPSQQGDGQPGGSPVPTAVTGPTARPATDMAVPATVDTKSTTAQERYRDTMLQEAAVGATPKNPASVRRYLMMDRNAYQNRSR